MCRLPGCPPLSQRYSHRITGFVTGPYADCLHLLPESGLSGGPLALPRPPSTLPCGPSSLRLLSRAHRRESQPFAAALPCACLQ